MAPARREFALGPAWFGGKSPLVKRGNNLGTNGSKYPRKRATSKELKARRTNKIARLDLDS